LKGRFEGCDHDWIGKEGGGAACANCGKTSLRAAKSQGGLDNGVLTGPSEAFLWLADKWAKALGKSKAEASRSAKP
jgi:hypothetical protein